MAKMDKIWFTKNSFLESTTGNKASYKIKQMEWEALF